MAVGYDSDLNIEGWHDAVYRDHADDTLTAQKGQKLETAGLVMAKKLSRTIRAARMIYSHSRNTVGVPATLD